MKIEIGKCYISRGGGIFFTEKNDEGSICYPFMAKGMPYIAWTREGFFQKDKSESSFDLIKEVRVTIEEVEPVSEFREINILLNESLGLFNKIDYIKKAIEEVHRLQKLFEGEDENS